MANLNWSKKELLEALRCKEQEVAELYRVNSSQWKAYRELQYAYDILRSRYIALRKENDKEK